MGVQIDLFDVDSISELYKIQEFLSHDSEYLEKNNRGNRMYSSGMKKYFEFLSSDSVISENSLVLLDTPLLPSPKKLVTTTQNGRNRIIVRHAIQNAGYACEINHEHHTFMAKGTSHLYMEGHHIIPLNQQKNFEFSLDCYANIVSLCPNCHRQLHHGIYTDNLPIFEMLYHMRIERLHTSGIDATFSDFREMVT